MTRIKNAHKNMRVRTQKLWRRDEFFRYLELEIGYAQPPIPHVTRLAELAGLSPSTISNWKTGKQRPTLDKLAAIANVLGKPRRELWLQAGLVEAGDVDGETPEEADPRLRGLDPNDKVVQTIMALDVSNERKVRMLNRRRQILADRERADLEELEFLVDPGAEAV